MLSLCGKSASQVLLLSERFDRFFWFILIYMQDLSNDYFRNLY